MGEQNIFKRYELKYLLTRSQYEQLNQILADYMVADSHGKSIVCSLYFDTPDYLLIRRSIEKPLYKEKLRLRSYGVANPSSKVYIEIKKKFDGVVYKRRLEMSEQDAQRFLVDGAQRDKSKIEKNRAENFQIENSQIGKEIVYFMKSYGNLAPICFLSCSRTAFYGQDNPEFRITFDEDIRWRDYDLNLCAGLEGERLMDEDLILMEIKVLDHMPLWLVHFLSVNHIYKTSFSKYGTAYKKIYIRKKEGSKKYVS